MTTATPNPTGRTIASLDVPAAIERDEQLVAQDPRTQWLVAHPQQAEQIHHLDPCDTAFARLACTHPEQCSTEADYPGWTPGGTR